MECLGARSSRIRQFSVSHHSRSSNANVLRRGTAAVATVGVMLLILSSAGWLALRDLASGTGGIRIRLNWTLIVGLGVPFIALSFLILWLSDRMFSTPSQDNDKTLALWPALEDGQSRENHEVERTAGAVIADRSLLSPLAASMNDQPPTTSDRRLIVVLIFAAGVVAGAIYALTVLLAAPYGGFS